jgi:hypothetical protein
MDAIDIQWTIVITCGRHQMGRTIPATGWDVHSKLAMVRTRIPADWSVEAYPTVYAERGPAGERIGHVAVLRTV